MGDKLQQAQLLYQHGEFDQALAIYLELYTSKPDDLALIQNICLLYAQKDGLDLAEHFIQQNLKKFPQEGSLHNSLGNILSRKARYHDAIQAYQAALSCDAIYPSAWNNMGNCYLQLHDHLAAKACYHRALEIDDDYPDANFNLARLLTQENQIDNAIILLKKVVAIIPIHSSAHGLLAQIFLEKNDFQQVIDHTQQRLSIQPQHAPTHQTKGLAHLKMNELDQAILHFQQALAIDPHLDEICHQLATAHFLRNNRQEALKYYLQETLRNKNILSLYNIGVILSDQQRIKEAIDYFQEVLTIDPKHLSSILNIAALRLKNGNLSIAIDYYKKAQTLDPSNQETLFILQGLTQNETPEQAPQKFIQDLFDQYALSYDKHLCHYLDYRVPEQLHQLIMTEVNPDAHILDILDLGCGTGLLGALLAESAKRLIGVDISSEMLNVADAKNVYDELMQADILLGLKAYSAMDLVVAAEVFPYLGDLNDVFKQTAQTLKNGGYFAFSIEQSNEPSYTLQKTLRYAHSKKYIESLSYKHGFDILHCDNTHLRKQKEKSVDGFIFLLKLNIKIV